MLKKSDLYEICLIGDRETRTWVSGIEESLINTPGFYKTVYKVYVFRTVEPVKIKRSSEALNAVSTFETQYWSVLPFEEKRIIPSAQITEIGDLSQRRVTFHLPDGSQESCSDSGLGDHEPVGSGTLISHPLPLVQPQDEFYDQASPDKRTEADGNSDPNSDLHPMLEIMAHSRYYSDSGNSMVEVEIPRNFNS
ncbi:hypothetical protein MJG53_009931 [Ovis ammon polii x Ovis aries]|uniref:Uncharacterized protein n=1 Tax=Ovis ammon polii x Ovis aries TaxID=2918886 RepID=A0ACB9UVF1_9CETA|nr:hypothetical protein MJG53_009931 [Ovis ammon polii x Ovis aries]